MWKQAVDLGSRTIELETGRIGKQANGAVLLREGDTVILSTVVCASEEREGRDFLPLTVDYRETLSAIGRIPGSFMRREGRASDREVLASRLCDRSLRPLFPKQYRAETQVISTVLSYGPASDAAVLSIIAGAAAMHISEIPFAGPVAAVRVGRVLGELGVMPGPTEMQQSDLDLIVSVNPDGVVMMEGGARQVPDADMVAAIEFAREQAQPVLELIERMRAEVGREKIVLPDPPAPPAFLGELETHARGLLAPALTEPAKLARREGVSAAKRKALTAVEAGLGEDALARLRAEGPAVLERIEAELLRKAVAEEQRRVDGRGPTDVRPIACEVDWLPVPHGSALFTRGETQAMVTVTLGTLQERQMVESVDGVNFERFLLHYSFPPYSVGEVRPMRGPGRREVGHGALARRALEPLLPPEKDFPYTLRVVSEISESNGSSSMATVCGGSMALMDAGVPVSAPVAGIAMGMVKEGETVVVLSDILGDEDHLGDMDFKVAGTAEGVTAIQMDNKLGSLPGDVMASAFEQARQGRLHILKAMADAIGEPRPQLKANAPVNAQVQIAANRVRDLIGPGGRVIQEIQRNTGARMDVNDEGQVNIYAPNREALNDARSQVLEVAGSLEVGEVYDGVVTGVKEFGAFVRIRGQEGLVHISEWSPQRVAAMNEVVKEGETVRVKVLEPDRQGRLSLSRKAAL